MTRDDAIQKIRKLLQTSGRTSHESQTAQILAAALADKHQIDIAALDEADQRRVQEITHQEAGEWAVEPPEATFAACICDEFFEVSSFARVGLSEKRIMVGTAHHLAIASYVFIFLLGEFRRAWNRRPSRRCRARKKFMWGAYCALAGKLRDRFETTTENALAISWKAKRDDYKAKNFGAMKSVPISPKKAHRGVALAAGYTAGLGMDIRPGVDTPDHTPAEQIPAARPVPRQLGYDPQLKLL